MSMAIQQEAVQTSSRIKWMRSYLNRVQARYDAATTNPESERYWSQADYLSPRSANNKAIRCKLRSRSRYECRESNSFACGMLQAKTNDVIGTGPTLQIQTPDAAYNQAVETAWNNWTSAVRLARKLRTAYSAKIGDGEGFIQRIRNSRLRTAVQLDLHVTEADLWTNPQWTDSAINEVDGIFFDDAANPVSYRRLTQHPGDDMQFGAVDDFVDVDADDVIHWFRADRPDQRRGIPEFTPALPLFAELRRYRLAVLSAAETAADFTAVMFSDSPVFNEDPGELPEGVNAIDIERRTMMTLPFGWKMQQFKAEQPTTEFGAFSEHILMEIGRVLQMPLNIVAGSSREYNFASGRLDYLLYWNGCDVEQDDCASVVLDRIFDWWFDEAVMIPGYLPPAQPVDRVPRRWVFPPRRPIDEVKAAQADEIQFKMGHLTDEDWCKREGIDPDQYYASLDRMITKRTEIGAPLPGSTGQQNVTDARDQPTDQAAA